MLRLLVIRHAKSSWKDASLSDHERPLNKRGKRDAPRVADAIKKMDWVPDHVLCSDARRAVDTFDRLSGTLPESDGEGLPEL